MGMELTWLDGKRVAQDIAVELSQECASISHQLARQPKLVVLWVGEDRASQLYIRNKQRMAAKLGMLSEVIQLAQETTQEELLSVILTCNQAVDVDGIIVQLPLPKHLDVGQTVFAIDPRKDVDGLHPVNLGRLLQGQPGMVPCTPAGMMALLQAYNLPVLGKRATIVGRSTIVGKPMAALLLAAHATVTIAHSHTHDVFELTRQADLVVVAIGKPGWLPGHAISPGAIVLDVGISRLPDGRLCGDVDAQSVSQVAGFLTPVPGGIGPLTVIQLMRNTLQAARQKADLQGGFQGMSGLSIRS